MILKIFSKRLHASVLALCVLTLSACVPGLTPLDAHVPGSRALSADEYVERYAGKSIRFGRTFKGPTDTEMYFAKDRSLQIVYLDAEIIQEGTWLVNAQLGGNIVLYLATSGIENGRVFRTAAAHATMFVYVLPDGTASVFSRSPDGASLITQPKPTPGFKARGRYDALKRKIDAALGA
jgi:hypothetical protein